MPVGVLIDVPCFHAVPATPTLDMCAVYDTFNRALQFIESTWMEVVCCTDCTEKFSDVCKKDVYRCQHQRLHQQVSDYTQ